MEKEYLKVIVPTPLWQTFDYLPPDKVDISSAQLGVRLKIPFGKRQVVGILWEIVKYSEIPSYKIKKAIQILDDKPLISKKLIKLYQWASDYYHYPLGELIFSTLPKALRNDKQAETLETPIQSLIFSSTPPLFLNQDQQVAVDAIAEKEDFRPFVLAGITGSGKTEVYLQSIANCLKKGKQCVILILKFL